MHRHGQAAAMHPVGAVKQLLEGAGVEQADRKLKLLSLSGISANSATFFSPRDAKSSSSVAVSAATLDRLNFSNRAARVIWMDFKVLALPER